MSKLTYEHPAIVRPPLIAAGIVIKLLARLIWPLVGRRTRALVRSGDHILLIQNFTNADRWTLPGGGYARGETSAECLVRELHEELRLSLQPSDFHSPSEHTERHEHRTWHYDCLIVDLDTIPELRLSCELLRAQWFHIDNLPKNRSPYIDNLLSLLY